MKEPKVLKCLQVAAAIIAAAGPRLAAQTIEKAIPVQGAEAAAAVSPTPIPNGVGLRPGDALEIRIANVPPEDMQQFSGMYTIDEDGMLNLPYVGLIKAGGMPASQVQIEVQNKLIAAGIYTRPTVVMNPTAGARYITVGGAVRGPGRIPYTSDLTLMSAINAAGGVGDFGGDKIRLTRGGKVQFYSRKKLYKDPSQDPRIEPGDQIEVVEAAW